MTHEEQIAAEIIERVKTLAQIPAFAEECTGGLSPLEISGRITARASVLAELMMQIRERGVFDNMKITIAGALAQVGVFLLYLAAKNDIDLLAAIVSQFEAEKKARREYESFKNRAGANGEAPTAVQ